MKKYHYIIKMTFIIYIFILYILFTPGIFLKSYYHGFANSLLFSLILYATGYLFHVNESFELNLEVAGANNLVDFKKETNDNIDVTYNNDLYVKPKDFSTGNEYINILNETTPEIIKETNIKDEISNVKGLTKEVADLRDKITNLNDEIDQMMKDMKEYSSRHVQLLKFEDDEQAVKMGIDNYKSELKTCNQTNDIKKKQLETSKSNLSKENRKEIKTQKDFYSASKLFDFTTDKYNVINSRIENYNCSS